MNLEQVKAIYKIRTQGKPEIDTSKYSDVFLDFLDKCLEVDVNLRWNATQLLKHPFLKTAHPLITLVDLIRAAHNAAQAE